MSATITTPDVRIAQLAERMRHWGIYTPGELRSRCKELDSSTALIARLIPHQSLGIVVGDSGLGKSPLLYQAAICVAAGIPFLGYPVSRGNVLYLDFENGLGDVDNLTTRLSGHLGLDQRPENLLLWNYNDAPLAWTPEDLAGMIRDVRPTWVVIDPLTAYAPAIEEKSSHATTIYQELRTIMRECGVSITGVHHLRKPSGKPEEALPPLEDDPHRWFLQARGARALINGGDVRIGLDRLGRTRREINGNIRDVALVLGGFGRVRGNIATTYIARVLDDDGEPAGYEPMSGAGLLFNSDQEQAYQRLPAAFRFKDAQRIYDRGPQATIDFLKKCISVSIMRKDGMEYRKLEVAEQPD